MAKPAPDPCLEAWLRTTVAASLSPIKRKNYFTRLISFLVRQESGLKASAAWPRLPLAWTAFPDWEASRRGGMPWPVWSNHGVAYRVMLLEAAEVGAFLRALAAFAAPFVAHGVLVELFAWVAWDTRRAWVFVDGAPPMGRWSDGEEWQEPWAGDGPRVWVEWSRASSPPTLRVRWDEDGRRRDFVPDAHPPPRDFDVDAGDVRAMRALLAAGPLGADPEHVCDWLRDRNARGDVQIRLVPLVFEGLACLPHEGVFQP